MSVIACRCNRCQMIPLEASAFAFHSSFFIATRRGAELRLVAPVRPKCHEPRRLLALRTAQDSLHGRPEVVVSQQAKHTSEIMECQFVRFQKILLARMRICMV